MFFCFCRDAYPMLLVANKIDLVRQRRVTEEQGRQLAARLRVIYLLFSMLQVQRYNQGKLFLFLQKMQESYH